MLLKWQQPECRVCSCDLDLEFCLEYSLELNLPLVLFILLQYSLWQRVCVECVTSLPRWKLSLNSYGFRCGTISKHVVWLENSVNTESVPKNSQPLMLTQSKHFFLFWRIVSIAHQSSAVENFVCCCCLFDRSRHILAAPMMLITQIEIETNVPYFVKGSDACLNGAAGRARPITAMNQIRGVLFKYCCCGSHVDYAVCTFFLITCREKI